MEAHAQAGVGGGGVAYLDTKAMWFTYLLIIYVLHLFLLSIPGLSIGLAWTLTNVIHDVVMWFMLHIEKGSPFDALDQGKTRLRTVWEQLDHGEYYSATKKFYMIVPIVLFMLATFYSKYDPLYFAVNAICLVLLALVPKLPQLDRVRLFGINKY